MASQPDVRKPARASVLVLIPIAAIGFRALSAIIGMFATLVFPLDRPQQTTMFGSPSALWDQFTRYDAGWYYQIARYGYWFVPGGPSAGIDKPGKIAYFPLYPLTMRYAARLFGHSAADVYLGGIAVSSAYVYRLSGRPFEWAASISRWGYHPGGAPWTAPLQLVKQLATHPYVYLASDPMAPYDTLYGVTGILFLIAIPFVWRRFGAGYGLFMLLNLLLPFSSGAFEGVGRYCSVLFPCFIWLATIRSRALFASVVVLFAMFYTLGLALFTTLHPLF